MDPHKRMLTLPGPGGYEIKFAPGAVHIPLTPAMSSHLMLECDHFDKLKAAGGLAKKYVTLHATTATTEDEDNESNKRLKTSEVPSSSSFSYKTQSNTCKSCTEGRAANLGEHTHVPGECRYPEERWRRHQ